MADDSPGKVQALRAIFSEKNKPVMGMMPPGGKILNRPWRQAADSSGGDTTFKDKFAKEQRTHSQLKTKVLPFLGKNSLINGDLSREISGIEKSLHLKPAVGPKPSHLLSQSRTNSTMNLSSDSVETNDDENVRNRTFSDASSVQTPQTKSRAFGETIATFMFSNSVNKENDRTATDSVKTRVPPPIPKPRNVQQRTNLTCQTDFMNLRNSQNKEGLPKCDLKSSCGQLISSDNYVCKSNNKFRRRDLPPFDKLGPAPLKPVKPAHLKLPDKYRFKNITVVGQPQPPVTAAPALPQKLLPQRPSYPCPPRPHTPPPLPPVIASKTSPSSLREEIEELYEDTLLGESRRPASLIPEYTEEEELYNDAEEPDDAPSIPTSPKPKDIYPRCHSEYLQPNVHDHLEEELYQDAETVDHDEFYEVMPCDAQPEESGSPLYSNNKKEIEKLRREEEKRLRKEQKEKEKRDKEMEKLRKKFGLTGEEIPIDDGLVKADSRGGKGDLPVKKGETVLILRMEGNPSGRWLVKNEKGKIGYVELTNIEVDPLSVKSGSATEDDVCTTPTEKNVTWLSKITACVR